MQMYEAVLDFVQRQGIRSYQEIRLLLFLWQHPKFAGTYQQFCDCLYVGDCPLMEQIITRLRDQGVIESCDGCYKLADRAELNVSLERLAQAFEQPLARQQLLAGLERQYS
jgi:predicted transcriptional regulator